MFLIDGKPLNEQTNPKEYKWMQEKLQEIRATDKKRYTFKSFNKRVMLLRDDNRKIPQKERYRLVSVKGSTDEATGIHQEWAYAPGMGALESDGFGSYSLKRSTIALEFDTKFDVKKDIELIFFFLHLSNNKNVKEVDYVKEKKTQVESASLLLKAQSFVYGEDSPLNPNITGSESEMRNTALAWGVANVENMDIYSVMHSLWTKVEESEKTRGRGYKKFIEEVSNYANLSKKSTVVTGINNGLIYYNQYMWRLKTGGGAEMFLCGVPTNDEANKDNYVIKFILDNHKVFEMLETSLKEPVKEEPTEADLVVPSGKKRFDLLAEAKALGWVGSYYRDISKMTKNELELLVQEKRKPEIHED